MFMVGEGEESGDYKVSTKRGIFYINKLYHYTNLFYIFLGGNLSEYIFFTRRLGRGYPTIPHSQLATTPSY